MPLYSSSPIASIELMQTHANVDAVRDFIERGWNRGEDAVFEEHMAADIAHPGGGREGFRLMVLEFRAAFPDLRMDVNDIFGAEDKVVTRFSMSGTHRGRFLGVEPAERHVRFTGIAIDVMRDGVRVGGGAELDRLSLIQQLKG